MIEPTPTRYPDLEVHPSKEWAVGLPGILH